MKANIRHGKRIEERTGNGCKIRWNVRNDSIARLALVVVAATDKRESK